MKEKKFSASFGEIAQYLHKFAGFDFGGSDSVGGGGDGVDAG